MVIFCMIVVFARIRKFKLHGTIIVDLPVALIKVNGISIKMDVNNNYRNLYELIRIINKEFLEPSRQSKRDY